MKLIIATIVFILSCNIHAFALKGMYEVKSAKATYHVSYLTKNVTGTSTNIKGKVICEKTCSFLFAAPVKSFVSGDGNRDLKMIGIVKAATHPMVMIQGSLPINIDNNKFTTDLEVIFSGKKYTYKKMDIMAYEEPKDTYLLTGKIPLVLTNFDIERPSLLMIKIDDLSPVDFKIVLKKK